MKKLTSLIIPVFLITGCEPSQAIKVEHNYHEIKDHLIPWEDVFSQEEHDYLVYFYSERCGHCNSIKNDVISYYLTTEETMYFVCTDIDAVFGSQSDLTGIDNITDFYIFVIPFLARLVEYAISKYYVGSSAILDYIHN